MTTWSTTETTIEWVSQDDASITFQVVKQNGGTGGGGVTDHGALTGLADDDHKQYQRAESVYTTTSPFTITDESLVVTTGSAVTLPDSTAQTGRMVSVGAGVGDVTISAAGSDTIHGVGATFTLPVGNGVTFVALTINGATGWSIINRRGAATDLPEWYSQGIADGNLVTLQSGVPAWTTGTRTAYEFLSGTGWTSDVPVFVPVKNTTASTIAKGAPVYATGTVGSTSVIEIAPADADAAATMPAIGLTESQLVANATGYVIVVGTLKGVDTSTYTVNQALYVSTTAGQLTGTKPSGASELIQNIGRVTRVNANNGEILVLGPGRTNDVPNAIDAGKLTSGTVSFDRLPTGTTSTTVAVGNDARLSDARTPTAHKTSHATGGTDALAPSDIGAVPTSRTVAGKALTADVTLTATDVGAAATSHTHSGADITSGTVAAARLGSGTPSASNFLRGDGTWSTPTGSGDVVGPASSVDGRVALFDGTTGKLLKQSAATLATVATSGSASDLTTGTVASARLPSIQSIYGTGVDGTVTISANTTLSADTYYANLTVNSGVTLTTAGFRVFVSGTLSGSGTIANNGAAASVTSGGSAATGNVFGAGGGGGNGGATTGTQPSAVANRIGGTGGAGGNGTSGNGGAAQTSGANAANQGGTTIALGDPFTYSQGRVIGAGTGRMLGGNGGSGGGGDGTAGGGGGGGGGLVYVAARTVTFTGSIEATGGTGGTPAGGNRGGGGGGGGGVVVVVTGSTTATFTTSAAGGAGGSSTGTGTPGSTGGTGTTVTWTGVV